MYLSYPDQCKPGYWSFKGSWKKDFHVSPFNPRNGEYSLYSRHPISSPSGKNLGVENNITLISAEKRAKMVARMNTTGAAVNIAQASAMEWACILARWWYTGLLTFPRVLMQAAKLYFAGRLPIWIRPEVEPGTLPRAATQLQRTLEPYFRLWLRQMVATAQENVTLRYYSRIDRDVVATPITLPSNREDNVAKTRGRQRLELVITTPAFYSRAVRYADLGSLLLNEALCADKRERTARLVTAEGNDFGEIRQLFGSLIEPQDQKSQNTWAWNRYDRFLRNIRSSLQLWACFTTSRFSSGVVEKPESCDEKRRGYQCTQVHCQGLEEFIWSEFSLCVALKLSWAIRLIAVEESVIVISYAIYDSILKVLTFLCHYCCIVLRLSKNHGIQRRW